MKKCGIDEWRIDIDNNVYIMHDWGTPRTILPEPLRQEAIEHEHAIGHYGRKRTRNIVAKKYYWKGLTRDVNKVVQACEHCQKNKVTPSQRRDYRHFPVTSRFKTVHMDIVGPMARESHTGKKYILTIMDRFSRWVEAWPMRSENTVTICRIFWEQWICRFGSPTELITDQGVQFESKLFKAFCDRMGIRKHRTTPYHPQSNGMIERMHRVMKETMRCIQDRFVDWEASVQPVCLALRTAINDWGVSPSLVMYAEQISVPGQMIHKSTNVPEGTPHEFLEYMEREAEYVREIILANDETINGPSRCARRFHCYRLHLDS